MKFTYSFGKTILTCIITTFLTLGVNKLSAQNDMFGSLTFNKAINISGKQRMLGQKLAKSYVYLVNNPTDAKAKRDLLVSKLIFEKQNKILLENAMIDATRQQILKVQNLWADYSKLFEGTPSAANAKKIIAKNSTLLQESNAVVIAIIADSAGANENESGFDSEDLAEDDTSLKSILNISGRQRMLSQRLALYYFANTDDLKDKTTEGTLKRVVYALDTAIGTLLISEFNTSRIDEKLAIAMAKWETIKDNVDKLYKQEIPAKEIYQLTNALTKTFNDVTTLYEKVKI